MQLRRSFLPWAILLGVWGCTAAPPGPSPGEIRSYLEHVGSWAPHEAEIARAINRLLRSEFVDIADVQRNVTDTLPRIDRQLGLLHAYQPTSPVLRGVHDRYVGAWADLRDGYAAIARGIESHDQVALARGRSALITWRDAIRATADRLQALLAETEEAPPT